MNKPLILTIVGTRPEGIKLAPVIIALSKEPKLQALTVCTGQHRFMLKQVFNAFEFQSDVDLNLMQDNQSLPDFISKAIVGLSKLFSELRPTMIVVQGDTSTAMAASMVAFMSKIPTAHIEAGLRSKDLCNPFPEEFNRRLITLATSIHFAPTVKAKQNLLYEGVLEKNILITGNTVVDALRLIKMSDYFEESSLRSRLDSNVWILVTCHRRENFGAPLINICRAVKRLLATVPNLTVIFPVHPNPNVNQVVVEELSEVSGVLLTQPLIYGDLLKLMSKVKIILTDSGGIQEEAPSFGVPVLILRDVTERPEIIECGGGLLVGTTEESIYNHTKKLLENDEWYKTMTVAKNPFGDGNASKLIVDKIINIVCEP